MRNLRDMLKKKPCKGQPSTKGPQLANLEVVRLLEIFERKKMRSFFLNLEDIKSFSWDHLEH